MKALETFYSHSEKSVIYRINKKQAEKLFNLGCVIYLTPNKARFDSVWVTPHSISNKSESSFTSIVNDFKYYNCISELGKGVHYYVKANDNISMRVEKLFNITPIK